MTHDPLEALLRLRRMAADEARRDLAECLRIESEAAAAVAAIKAAIERETEVATSLAAGDAEVEAFGAWLRRIRPMQRAALAAEDAAETATVRCPHATRRRTGSRAGGGGDAGEARRRSPCGGGAQGAGRDRRGWRFAARPATQVTADEARRDMAACLRIESEAAAAVAANQGLH